MTDFTGGLLTRFKTLLDTGLEMVQTRLELFSVELKEEKCRIIESLIWASAAIFLTTMALVVTTFTFIFVVWENREARVAALLIFSLLYIGAAVGSFLMLRKRLREIEKPFSDSIREIRKDRQWLNTHN